MPPDYSYTGVDNASIIINEKELQPSSLETIDYAFYDFMNESMNLRAYTNKGWKRVPLIWASSERVYFSKRSKELRDLDGTLILPIISIEKKSVAKSLTRKGAYFGAGANFIDPLHGGRITLARKIVPDKTNNFAVADNIKKFGNVSRTPNSQPYFPRKNKKVVYETLSIPIPVYLSINYTVTIRTEYVQQMNDLVAPFATLGGHINSFHISRDGHRYETFMQSEFALNNNSADLGENERVYETGITFEVLGHIIGDGPNGDRPKIIKRQNAVEVKLPREHVILGDIPDHVDSRGFYRE